ncbi:serine carboxypeptidase-like 18 isoform X2 [Brachypodium distachyon]|uniref:serine carboxypeptidase-like 18 isoform X2 n=1 Tax=Brachypodium distachyon TaxID=15368 RepID=UPI000D0CB25F|nr:serine carboxypeptidase-like 18 isoform X2 [Brachypodium distachyon]|eukprot:XP_014758143.2 serine carboxypeptidase-like 18 isoform X2 [Brachypodium distachyon]
MIFDQLRLSLPSIAMQWYAEHREFLSKPLYIAGDSYSGLITPPLTFQIAKGTEMGDQPALNLKGYMIGNPLTDRKFDVTSKVPYAHGMGLIPDEQYEIYKESCSLDTGIMNRSVQCADCHDAIDKCLKDINVHHILEPKCSSAAYNGHSDSSSSSRMMMLELDNSSTAELNDLSQTSKDCRDEGYVMSSIWANKEEVREALGVHKGSVPLWLRCNHGIPYTTDILSSVEYHRSLLTSGGGYRSLVYSGDHDMVVPFVGTQAWIRSLGFAIVDQWRPWYADIQVAGFTRMYSNNLTFATVKGGGHTAPEYKPKECLAMVVRWLSGRPL